MEEPMTSRRLFLGSVAGVGVGAVGVTTLDFSVPVSAQPAAKDPLNREIRKQLKDSLHKMQFGSAADGARQAATTMRIYAATVNDAQLRAALRRADRVKLLARDMNHAEMEKAADDLGVQRFLLNHAKTAPAVREAALNRLLKEGLSPMMRQLADELDKVAPKLQAQMGAVRAVSLRQPIPDCGSCDPICNNVGPAEDTASVICAAAVLFPALAELCAAALAAYLSWVTGCAVCQAYLRFCNG
jgi:hypothetical protein